MFLAYKHHGLVVAGSVWYVAPILGVALVLKLPEMVSIGLYRTYMARKP